MQPNDQTIATITQRLRESASVTEAMGDRAADIARAASLIAQSVQRGGKLLLCGNGGSAADASTSRRSLSAGSRKRKRVRRCQHSR
jgi:D-sedoheptulose 7-phosphate isomerase